MRNKLLLVTALIALTLFVFAISSSAAVTTYDDAPAKEIITVSTDDVVVFDDGFTCLSAYIFIDTDTISEGDFMGNNGLKHCVDFSFINEKTGKTYDISNIKELDIPEGIAKLNKYSFTRLPFKRISIPKTVTTLGICVFEKCSELEECVFEHTENSELASLSAWMFQNCTSLVAFSFPDCIEAINADHEFAGCTSLTAVYLPKNLTSYTTSSSNEASAFYNCQNMYFVNEPFTYDNIPEKPSVYYFPSGLTTMTGELFKVCKNLNETLVFPEGVTAITNSWAFETNSTSTVKNIVFLGDMTALNTSNWKMASGSKIIFANENDKDASSLTSLSGGHTKIYCATETEPSNHLAERVEATNATCTENKSVKSYCFCGKLIEEKAEEGTSLGHSHTVFVDLVYADISKDGYYSYKCERCDDLNNSKVASALFVNLGYSAPEYDDGVMSIGFKINEDAISAYEQAKGVSLSYGAFAGTKDDIGNNDVFDKDGKVQPGVIAADVTDCGFVLINLKIHGFTEEQKGIDLAMGVYVNTAKDSVSEYTYLQDGTANEGDKYCFLSYNDVRAILASKQS